MRSTADELSPEKRLWLAEQEERDLRDRADAAHALWDAKRAQVERLRTLVTLAAGTTPTFSERPNHGSVSYTAGAVTETEPVMERAA